MNNIISSAAAIFSVAMALIGTASCQEAYLRVPAKGFFDGFDYGTLAFELCRNNILRNALELSEEQVAKVNVICSSDEFKWLHLEFSKALDDQSNRKQEIDESLRKQLGTALSDLQLQRLRKWLFFSKFRGHFRSTLGDAVVVRFVGFDSGSEWATIINDAEQIYPNQENAARESAVKSILAECPPMSRVLFAQYLGEKYFAAEMVEPEIEPGSIPFQVTSLSSGLAKYIFNDQDFVRALNLDARQIDEVKGMINKFGDSRKGLLSERRNLRDENRLLNELHNESFRKMDNVLRPAQKLALARVSAAKQFEIDPTRAMENIALRKYLGYDPMDDDWSPFTEALKKYSTFLEREMDKLNALKLREVAKRLPDDCAQRLIGLFRNVWNE